MATLDDKIAKLEAALASGTTSVSYDGTRIEYNSVGDLKDALEYFKAQKRRGAGSRSVTATVATFARD